MKSLRLFFSVYSLDKGVILCSLHQYTNVDLWNKHGYRTPCSNKIQTRGDFQLFLLPPLTSGEWIPSISVWSCQWEIHGLAQQWWGCAWDWEMIDWVQYKQDINFWVFIPVLVTVCSLWKQGGLCKWEMPRLSLVQNQLVSEKTTLAMLAALPSYFNQGSGHPEQLIWLCIDFAIYSVSWNNFTFSIKSTIQPLNEMLWN